jgi:hypothetical protein
MQFEGGYGFLLSLHYFGVESNQVRMRSQAMPNLLHEHGDKGRQGVNEFLDNFTSGSRE